MADMNFNVSVQVAKEEGLQMVCKARNFELLLDEPVGMGGKDTGMTPVEALLSALGGCKGIVAKIFAPKFRVEFSDLTVDVEGVLDPDGMAGTEGVKIGFSKIKTHYHFTTNNSEKEVQRLIEYIEGHCPVMDTMINAPEFSHEVHIQGN